MNDDPKTGRTRRALAFRRRAQARRVFDHRARPLSHRQRRGRRRAAPPRRGAVVEPAVWRYELFRRERRALAVARPLGVAPPLLLSGRRLSGARLDRRRAAAYRQALWRRRLFPFGQDGVARAASRRHSPQRSRQGTELALRRQPRLSSPISSSPPVFAAAGLLFRLARYEDLRHLLKHKRRYAPDALTAAERRVLGAQEPHHPGLDGDRKEGLLRDHARLEFHRPRGPRLALRPRCAGNRGAAAHPSAGARCRHRAVSGSPRRHRALCFRRRQRQRSRAQRISRHDTARAIAGRRQLCRAMRKAKCAAKFSNWWP